MTIVVKIGLIEDGHITETLWFHGGMNAIAIAVDGQHLQSFSATPAINICAPKSDYAARKEHFQDWGVAEWGDRVMSLPPGLNPFLQKSSGEHGSSILVPPK